MSIRSIAAMANERTQMRRMQGGEPGAGASGAGDTGQAPAGADTLLKSVPTEVVVLYTTVIGVLSGIIKQSGVDNQNVLDGYEPLRWWLYGGCILGTIISIPIAYFFTKTTPNQVEASDGDDRRWPISEMFMAAFSFAVWGLVIPGSPLYVVLRPPTLPVVVTVLSAGGAFVSTALFGPWLGRAAKGKRKSGS